MMLVSHGSRFAVLLAVSRLAGPRCKTFDLLLQTSSAGVAARGYGVCRPQGTLLHFVQGAIGETHLFSFEPTTTSHSRSTELELRQTSSDEVRVRGYAVSGDLEGTLSLRHSLGRVGNTSFLSSRLRLKSFTVKGEKPTA